MRRRAILVIFAVALFATPSLSSEAAADPGGGVPGNPWRLTADGVDAHRPLISPNGATIVYEARSAAGVEVVSQPAVGGMPTSLSGPIAGNTVYSIAISPDGNWVVYVADHEIDEKLELYAVPIGGGTVTKLNPPMIGAGDIVTVSGLWYNGEDSFLFTPDGSAVVFRADAAIDRVSELYVSDLATGAATRLHAPFADGGYVRFYDMTADGTVVYTARTAGNKRFRLYQTPSDDVDTTRISPLEARNVDHFKLSHDQQSVFWEGRGGSDRKEGMFVVPVAGGASVELSGPMRTGGDVYRFVETGDGSHVVYQASQDTRDVTELYSARVDGSAWRKLNGELPAGGNVVRLDVSPTDNSVVYAADQDEDDLFEMFRVDAAAGAAVQLSQEGKKALLGGFDPTGATFVFGAENLATEAQKLYAADTQTWAIKWISKDIGTQYAIDGDAAQGAPALRFTPDGARVTYAARKVSSEPFYVYSSRTSGAGTIALGGDPIGSFGQTTFLLNEAGTHARLVDDGALFYVAVKNYKCDGKVATHVGTPGRDRFDGTAGPDVIVGLEGGDTINAMGGADIVCGSKGPDKLTGGTGKDTILGGRGDDAIFGKAGDDSLNGNSGMDELRGGGGDDVMAGGSGADRCYGGPGVDTAQSCQTSGVP